MRQHYQHIKHIFINRLCITTSEISSSVQHKLKQHALQVFKISLTTVTIHVWKRAGLLAAFWIKQKFEDTSLHHTSLTLCARCWSHYLLLKEKIIDSLGYVRGAEVKSPFMYKWGGIYNQGWNWPLWLFDYPHDCLTSMTFWLYMTLCTTSGSLGLPHYITLIDNMAHSRDVDDMTHDTTRHDSACTFVLLLECMSSCSAAEWWTSSWCVTASPLHSKVHKVFDGRWFTWCFFGTLLLACMLLDRFVYLWKVHVRPFVRPWAHLFQCIIHSSVGEPVLLHVLPSFIPFIVASCLLVYLYL